MYVDISKNNLHRSAEEMGLQDELMRNDKKHRQEESSLLSIEIIKFSDFLSRKILLVSSIRVYFSHFFRDLMIFSQCI